MASWFLSWLPGLPSINLSLPSGLQRRFISFALKKFLGHLLKPGQFDVSQIDSQIGSGYVHVSNLELDTQAVNELLHGLPVQLIEGKLGGVTARIPWPNPLTSSVGLSLDGLHLVLRLIPPPKDPVHLSQSQNLNESVASVAESFIRDELTPREEVSLRGSFHTASIGEDNVPGGLDPFIATPEDGERETDIDADPAGISVFAALIERVLARFQFDATKTKIIFLHPGHTALTLHLDEIHYQTETEEGTPGEMDGEIRTILFSGFSMTSQELKYTDLETPVSSSRTSSPGRTSPASSSSSIDEDARWAMSQSLAALPPRPPSPASSVTSSMYQSAISTSPNDNFHDDHTSIQHHRESSSPSHTPSLPNTECDHEDVLFSLGSEPLRIRLITPPLRSTKTKERLQLSVTAGVAACALRAKHIRGIMDMLDVVSPRSSTSSSGSNSSSPPLYLGVDVFFEMRGIVGLALNPSQVGDSVTSLRLSSFFSSPLSVPCLTSGYVRVYLEGISMTFTISSSPHEKRGKPSSSSSASLSVTDISVFTVRGGNSDYSPLSAHPILVTDIHLPSQYSSSHSHPDSYSYPQLPSISVVDWTTSEPIGIKPSHWRTRLNSRHNDTRSPSRDKSSPVFTLSMESSNSATTGATLLAPVHIFLDVSDASVLLSFLNELSLSKSRPSMDENVESDTSDQGSEDYDEDGATPPATPQFSRELPAERQQAEQRRRLISDLGLELDYTTSDSRPTNESQRSKSRRVRSRWSVTLSMIRIEARCPPPSTSDPRSGAIIFDLHNITFTTGDALRNTTAAGLHGFSTATSDTLFSCDCKRVLVAYSVVGEKRAIAFLSAGPLLSTEANDVAPVRVDVVRSKPSDDAPLTVLINLPSLHVHLEKLVFDGLQYWADDFSRVMEVAPGAGSVEIQTDSPVDTSMIGSRFFAKSNSESSSGMTTTAGRTKNGTVVNIKTSEAFIRALVSRGTEESPSVVQPFDISARDTDIVVELKPEGKDKTIVTLEIMDLTVNNVSSSGRTQTLLSLTMSRSLGGVPRPVFKVQFASLEIPETRARESRVALYLWGFTYNLLPDFSWFSDVGRFVAAPPGVFESVVPSERTVVSIKVMDVSVRALAPMYPGALVIHVEDLGFSTSIVGSSPDTEFRLSVPGLRVFLLDKETDTPSITARPESVPAFWKDAGFALVADVKDSTINVRQRNGDHLDTEVNLDRIILCLHLCADTMSALGAFASDMGSMFVKSTGPDTSRIPPRSPAILGGETEATANMAIADDSAFRKMPEIGPAPDMVNDDLPSNLEYLDESFGTAAGFRELRDDDLEDFSGDEDSAPPLSSSPRQQAGVISKVRGETIKMLRPEGIKIVEHHFDMLPPETSDDIGSNRTNLRVRIRDADIRLLLYDGYDWVKTRKAIEEEVKEMRKRLTKIKQLVATGQTQDPSIEETSALLFNSVHIGLDPDIDELEPGALIAAIEEELKDDFETSSQSSWQSLRSPTNSKVAPKNSQSQRKRLTRSRGPSIEICLAGLKANLDYYLPDEDTVSRVLATVKDIEILDHIKTSTWSKFLTGLRSDSRGNIRETESNMARIELRTVRPHAGHPSEEARLRAKILPLRLHVDQDALDFFKKFFSFNDPDLTIYQSPAEEKDQIFFQLAEIFPVDLKLDYKPRRVDYRALREGRTIELMNFFHFDGAEMTLRHITLAGITGWPRLFDLLNDLWTPDVKATQLVDVISGVSPIRSVVNVGSGIADLVLLPISQYKKDGRIVRGVQKGAIAFVKSTATEAIKLGARLATGTQVILEQAEGVLGGQFSSPVTTETLRPSSPFDEPSSTDLLDEDEDLISKYAEQPHNVKEGVQTAYKSLRKNVNSAAQTILAVPMEVYERSGTEGPVRSVIRAVPIAVLKPMIGASEAVSKTLLGLQNTIDPNLRHENEAKYKHR